jgi:hypothetical protein
MRLPILLAVSVPVTVLSVAAAAYFGVRSVSQEQTIARLQAQITRMQEEALDAVKVEHIPVELKRTPSVTEKTLGCPLCEGQGKLVWQESRRQETVYPCPLCKAQGVHRISIPHYAELCETCGGMGKRAYPPQYDPSVKHMAKLCVRCTGRGWRRQK